MTKLTDGIPPNTKTSLTPTRTHTSTPASHPSSPLSSSSSSTLRNLRETFKFKSSRKSTSSKKDPIPLHTNVKSNHRTLQRKPLSESPSKPSTPIPKKKSSFSSPSSNDKTTIPNNNNNNKRTSAQKISLFKYDNVQVMNCFVPISASSTRRSSSSHSSSNFADSHSDKSDLSNTISVRIKPTSLMAQGPLEIYQIFTPDISSNMKGSVNGNGNGNGQTMNYLSIGRNSNIIHPLLPKLKVTKLYGGSGANDGYKYFINFYNPERFWEIDFLPILGNDMSVNEPLQNVIKEFERVISKVCQFAIIEEEVEDEGQLGADSLAENSSVHINRLNLIYTDGKVSDTTSYEPKNMIEEQKQDTSDDDDELNYLLEDINEEEEEEEEEKENNERVQSRYIPPTQVRRNSTSDILPAENKIQDAFRRAMENCSYSWEHFNGLKLKESNDSRRSMMIQPILTRDTDQSLTRKQMLIQNRRSISLFSNLH
ncbi:Inp1p NDAI_0I00600 [Naumovozyma dairenensis CBS 421]|uniref:Inheritance of peroxisomes protein 1 n=1 Tax=Naumovozyma dairenensis (strain ATCC 10597 / BCRC 20456 / CBS 421 / NBRC 0211 / NRRL Y-12639) TaxID=1071378 RepID=G0WFR8_NAUDC|nr:hypothetical protein NDAI_0I00600 [Naumovozyma dairenensis CBS 421]CCD26629.1 hypothetical protein NDAI_0I00600 [Naumovozyma dairenensis CBS 421]